MTPAEIQDLFDEANGALAIGDFDQAIALYRDCVAHDPEFFDAWHALAMGLLKTGQTTEAIGAGLMATTLRPNDLLAWTGLSQMYMRAGKIAEAEDAKGKARILSLGGRVAR